MELRQLEPAVAVRGAHHRDVNPYAVEPVDAVHPTSLDRRLALQLHAELDKERLGTLEVVDDDADVVHPLNRHGGSPSSSRGLSRRVGPGGVRAGTTQRLSSGGDGSWPRCGPEDHSVIAWS